METINHINGPLSLCLYLDQIQVLKKWWGPDQSAAQAVREKGIMMACRRDKLVQVRVCFCQCCNISLITRCPSQILVVLRWREANGSTFKCILPLSYKNTEILSPYIVVTANVLAKSYLTPDTELHLSSLQVAIKCTISDLYRVKSIQTQTRSPHCYLLMTFPSRQRLWPLGFRRTCFKWNCQFQVRREAKEAPLTCASSFTTSQQLSSHRRQQSL